MIYIFDKTQAIIKVLTNDDFTAAHLNFKINTATTFEFSLPASKALPSGSKYVATPHPLNDSKFIMLRLTERVDNTETIDYSAYELAYQELATDGYIEDKRPHNQGALNLMKIALDGSNWELNNVNVSGTATTNFYYVDRLSAISKVVDLLGGEIVFYIEIQGNAISGRYMDYLARQGADTSKVFASGSNLLTVERQSDTSGIYTAILPRGKGEEIDDGKADTPDGYGRRINIADVEWKKSAGKPLDKPKGSIVLSDPDATAEWGQINGNARLLLKTYDDIDDVNVLINSAYKTLQSVNHPQIQYSATVANVGGLSLGDTVLIMHGDRDLSYKTRVFEVKYDLLSPDQTELSLGDDLSSNSITSQINNLNAVADTTSSQTQWTINQIGRPGTTYGATAPDSPKVGDIWFKHLPDGGTEIHRWNGDIWELLASPTTADDIAKAVDDAVSQAKAHTDEVKQVLSSDIETAKSQAASLANAAEANAKSEAVSQFNQAQSILSDAKKDLMESIERETSERDKAVAAANSLAQKYVDEAKKDINDTINAFSVGGRNLLLNSKVLSWGVTNNAATTSAEVSYDSTTNMWHITSPKGGSENAGIYFFQPGNVSNIITKGQQWAFSIDIKGTGVYSKFGIEWSKPFNTPSGNVSTDWTRVSSTGTASGTNAIIIYFNSKDVALDVYIKLPKLEKGTIATDWTPAPEDVVLDYTTKDNKIKETITQYQDTNDGKVRKAQTDATTALGLVETKVSQTDYDKKTGDLSTKINHVKDTADKSLKTIADIQKADGKQDERMAEIEQTAEGIKSTVSDLSTAQEKQSGYISTLQQSAKGFEATVTKVDNLAVGGRNLLLGTRDWTDNTRWNQRGTVTKDVYRGMVIASTGGAWSSPVYMMQNAGILQVGKTYTFSTYVRNTSDTDTNVAPYYEDGIVTPVYTPTSLPAHTDWFRVSITFQCVKDPTTSTSTLRWEGQNALTNGQIQFAGYKLEEGNIATDWTPDPEDVDSTVAKVKLTADEASTAVSKLTSADGIITKAQAAIKLNADAINEKVSKTYYDKKTGELTHDLSELKHTAEGFEATVTKVDNLAVGGRNLLLGTRDWTDNTRWNQRGTVTKDVYRGMVIASTGGAWSSPVYMMQNAGILQVGKTYTFSTYVRNTSDTDTNVAPYYEDGVVTPVYTPTSLPAHTDWFRVSITFKCVKDPITSTSALRWEGQNGLTNGQIQFAGYKLEKGTIPTDWTPAPEDVQSDISQVKHTADGISNFVRDSSGNISSDFQTALSKTSIITGSTLASSIQQQTATQITSALTDNNGKIISLINQDSSGVQISGKNIVLDGNTTVTGTFWAKQVNAIKVDASYIKVGTLNGSLINITNINANNIVSGAISGANLNINLNTGQVQFQKGRINSSDYKIDVNMDEKYISTADSDTRVLLKGGQMQFIQPSILDLQSSPYFQITNNGGASAIARGASLIGRDNITIANRANANNVFDNPFSKETFSGLYTGYDGRRWSSTKVGGAERGVLISGGAETTWNYINASPFIYVGAGNANGTSGWGNRIHIHAEFLHAQTVNQQTNSHAANVYVSSDGALLRSSSATKYKTNIEHETDSIQGDQLLTIDPATWNDKFESEQLERYHETGVEPERQINMEGKRYYGIIAEDLVKAGLEELVTRNEETDEVEGVEYSKIGVALIPIVRDLRNKLNEQAVEIERLKDKIK